MQLSPAILMAFATIVACATVISAAPSTEGNHGESMHIKVITWDGIEFTLEVKPTDTIFDIKTMIYNRESAPQHLQRLSYNGKEIQSHYTLGQYNIPNGSTIRCDLYRVGFRGF